MSDLWAALLAELCPALKGQRHRMFFDLADPEKRTKADILRALGLIQQFQQYFDVILGLNEKEAYAIGEVLDLGAFAKDVDGLVALCTAIQKRLQLETLVVHPVTYALTVSAGRVDVVAGPTVKKPLITTGAGDHFNAGFCLGKLLGLDNEQALLCGVGTSGFYVRTAQSPHLDDLINMFNQWPAAN
jgi:sugar/nucleoside kinase (ribokinase family)